MSDFRKYQKRARETAIYPNLGKNFVYPALGLCGEAGEVAEKIKKIMRDKGGEVTDKDVGDMANELGDVLWYIANLCSEFGLDMDVVAHANLTKLDSRKKRGKLGGSGDYR